MTSKYGTSWPLISRARRPLAPARRGLRTLLRDRWVVGIACAAALAYTTIAVLDQVLAVVFSIVDGVPAARYEGLAGLQPRDFYSYDVVSNGHIVLFEPLLRAFALFAVTVVLSALALHTTRSPDDDTQ